MFLPVGDARIFTTAFGARNQPALLALSGWIGSWEDWLPTLSLLSEDWRVTAFDHRGSGITIAPPESITFDHLVDDVFAVLDHLHIQQCVLTAMSMGVLIALGAALRQPERFSALVLINGLYYAPARADSDPFLLALQHNYQAALKGFTDACVPEPASDHIKRWGMHILQRASQQDAITLYRLPGTVDLRSELGRIQHPALILQGEADTINPLPNAQILAAMLPNAQLKVIPGAGHVPMLTCPEVVTQHINAFLSNLAP